MKNLIYASTGLSLPKHTGSAKSVECAGCNSITTVQSKLSTPFCSHCGDSNTVVLEKHTAETASITEDMQLASLKCPGCSTQLITTEETASTYKGSINCTCCGTPILFDSSELAKEVKPKEEIALVDNQPQEEAVEVETSALDFADNHNLRILKDGGNVYVMSEHTLVATSDKTNTALANIINERPAVSKLASVMSGKTAYVKQQLATNGFELVKAKIDIPKIAQDTAIASLEATKREIEVANNLVLEDINRKNSQALSIACAGLDKGFFPSIEDKSTVSLLSIVGKALEKANVTDIDTVYSELASLLPEYQASIISVARTLLDKPDDVRNELAGAIEVANISLPDIKLDALTDLTRMNPKKPVAIATLNKPKGTGIVASLAQRAPLSTIRG